MSIAKQLAELEELAKDPSWFEAICSEASEAGSDAWAICKQYRWRPAVFRTWIEMDEGRKSRWAKAMAHRDDMRRCLIKSHLYLRATAGEIPVTEAGLIAASRMLLGMTDSTTTIEAESAKITIVHESS